PVPGLRESARTSARERRMKASARSDSSQTIISRLEEPLEIRPCSGANVIDRGAAKFSDRFGDAHDIGGLVAFPAMGYRRKKWTVRFDKQFAERHRPRHFFQLECAWKRHDPRERHVKADVDDALRQRPVARKAVEDAADVTGFLLMQDSEGVVFGFARVDDNRQAPTLRKANLFAKDLLLDVSRGEVVVIVETDLAKAAR